MGTRHLRVVVSSTCLALVGTSVALAGGNGFANKPGGGFNDPIIQIDASRNVDPLQPSNLGQSFTRTESRIWVVNSLVNW